MPKPKQQVVAIKRPKFEVRCGVCQFMRRNRKFKERIMLTKYFDPNAIESVDDVLKSFGYPVSRGSVYVHLRKHQGIERAEVREENSIAPSGVIKSVLLGEMIETNATDPHERLLDRLIYEGDALLDEGKLTLTTNQVLTAIKTKAEIQSKNKDRKVDALKTLFKGAAPDNGQPEGQD